MYRNTYVEVNLANMAHNIKLVVNKYKYKYYIGVVKGNAYGHGYGIIETLKNNGINFFAVSNLDEGLEIRKIDKETGIVCLEPISLKYLDICANNNISISVSSYDYYNELRKINNNLKIHLKIDSGMNRLGFNDKETINKVIDDLKKHDNLYLEGIFSHFATSGVYDKNYNKQLDRFKELTSDIDLAKIDIVHLDRSVTMCIHNKLDFVNGVRLGIIMYGLELLPDNINWDEAKQKNDINLIPYKPLGLKQTFSLISEVLEVKDVKKGDYIGYGTLYQAEDDMKIAIIDIGYADGISKKRVNSNMIIKGNMYQVIGDVCMGMTLLKVDDKVKKYDKVVVIGDELDVKSIAKHLHTSSYEVMCMIDSSIERRYK